MKMFINMAKMVLKAAVIEIIAAIIFIVAVAVLPITVIVGIGESLYAAIVYRKVLSEYYDEEVDNVITNTHQKIFEIAKIILHWIYK